jgi:hypothetical protein
MLHQPRSLKRSLVMGLAVCAIAPATAAASPIGGQGGGHPGATAQDLAAPSVTAPHHVVRGVKATPSTPSKPIPGQFRFPANPRAAVALHNTTAKPSAGSDVDTGVLIGLGAGGALLLAAGLGLAGHKRVQAGRGQLA